MRMGKAETLTDCCTFKEENEMKILGVQLGKNEKKSKRRDVGEQGYGNRKTVKFLEIEKSEFKGESFNSKCPNGLQALVYAICI